jgi:LysM repeat protein
VFEKYGEVGKMAWLARKVALDRYNNEANEITDELERFQKYSTLQELWREYQLLSSLKYADGTSKVDDPANGIYDLSIAKILIEHKEATRDYYEFIPRTGSLQTAFNEFLSLQESEGVTGDDLVKAKEEWVKQNIRVAYTQEFYDSRKDLIDRLKSIQGKVNAAIGEQFDISNAYNEIFNLMFAYKDEQGQPIPSEIGLEKMKMIKDLNQKIIDYKASFDTKTGLSRDEAEELELYIAINKKDPARLTDEQKLRYRQLLEKQAKTGLSLAEVAAMQSIYAELSSLTQKVATEYYVDSLNEHLQRLNVATVRADQVDDFINSQEMRNLLASDGKLVDWFRDNHVSRKVKNRKTRKLEVKYERSMANSLSVPKNEKYYEKTVLINPLSGKEEPFRGLPNARHSIYRVKNKYRTGYNGQTGEIELKVGVHIDNKGQFLPRMFTPGDKNSAKNNKFINQEYMRLKEQSNSARFQLLELMKEAHLSFQEGKSNKSKLYYDMPRYVLRDNLSRIQAGKFGERYSQVKKGIRQSLTDAFGKAVDEVELEHNYERDNNLEEYRLVNTDLNAEEVSYIPVSGIYNIDIENTDPDVVRSMFKYLLSLETQTQLLETLPLVTSILDTLEDPANAPKTPNTYSKTINRINGKLKQTTKPGASNNRAGQVRSLIEREYYGKQFSGQGSSVYLDKFVGQLQKLSARASLAINIPSDLKNRYGQIVQNMIESAGGEFITVKDLAKSRLWAAQTMLEWSSNSVYTKGVPALSSQMIEMFDAAFKFQDEFGRSVSRNFAKDMMNGEWMYSIRKNLEMEAALQLFGAFLNGQKVEQKLSNGKTITINYKDAWQINPDSGIAELKPGVDPAWSNKTITHEFQKGQTLQQIADMYGVTVEELKERNNVVNAIEFADGQDVVIARSEKFKQFRNKFQGVSHRLYGAYDKFSQAEGNLYLPYRMFTFMRKWFIPMFTNRMGASINVEEGAWKPKFSKRYNWMTGKTTIGFYINAYLGLTELIKTKGKYWSFMPEDQKRDLMRTLGEALFIITVAMLTSMLWGYDPDDKDRFKKIRERSGALGTDDFKTWGFIQNHMLLLLLGAQQEATALIPLPTIMGINFGMDDYLKMASTTTSAFGNTIGLYAKMLEDVARMLSLNEKAYYSRKEGEYFWQQEGSPKILGRLLKSVGITGSTGDVTQALKGLENAGKLK